MGWVGRLEGCHQNSKGVRTQVSRSLLDRARSASEAWRAQNFRAWSCPVAEAAWPVPLPLHGLPGDLPCALSQAALPEPSSPTRAMRPALTAPSTAAPLPRGPPIASAATATTERTWTPWTCPAPVRSWAPRPTAGQLRARGEQPMPGGGGGGKATVGLMLPIC